MNFEVEPSGYVRDSFKSLHNFYLRHNNVVHAYAEPNGNSEKTDPASLWFLSISNLSCLLYTSDAADE